MKSLDKKKEILNKISLIDYTLTILLFVILFLPFFLELSSKGLEIYYLLFALYFSGCSFYAGYVSLILRINLAGFRAKYFKNDKTPKFVGMLLFVIGGLFFLVGILGIVQILT